MAALGVIFGLLVALGLTVYGVVFFGARQAFRNRYDLLDVRARLREPGEVLERCSKYLEEVPRECGGTLRAAYEGGLDPLAKWSYWRRARNDMLRLYAYAAGAIRRVMRDGRRRIVSALQEAAIEIRDRKKICETCLERNRKRISKNEAPRCFLTDSRRTSTNDGGNEQENWEGRIDIGPDGELRIHRGSEGGQQDG